MTGSEGDLLIVFVKCPDKGKVKSRLSGTFSEESVVELYKCFVEDVLDAVGSAGFKPLVAFYPAGEMYGITTWLGSGYNYFPQTGADLGERMKNAFLRVFAQGSPRAVIIGSDIPELKGEIIKDAFESLRSHDVVIGPAFDGGYYLIGFSRDSFVPRIFEDMTWSADTVFSRTIDILNNEGRNVCVMPSERDIDRPEDVDDLIERSLNGPFVHSKTIGWLLKQNGHDDKLSTKTEK